MGRASRLHVGPRHARESPSSRRPTSSTPPQSDGHEQAGQDADPLQVILLHRLVPPRIVRKQIAHLSCPGARKHGLMFTPCACMSIRAQCDLQMVAAVDCVAAALTYHRKGAEDGAPSDDARSRSTPVVRAPRRELLSQDLRPLYNYAYIVNIRVTLERIEWSGA